MTRSKKTVSEYDLHAYVDGTLETVQQQRVEAYLAEHPEEAQRIAAYRELNDSLHEQFDPVLTEPTPARLRRAARDGSARRLWRVAAALGWLALGLAGGWTANELSHAPAAPTPELALRLVQPAAVAHAVYVPEVRHPVEVPANEEKHLVGWLSKRLGAEVQAPDLKPAGFALVGGRLLPGSDGGTAAQFMYEDLSGLRLTLYLRSAQWEDRETAFRYTRKDGVSMFYWIDGPFGYALAGELDRERLLEVARLVYR